MNLADIHRVVVLGAGESGTGAAILAKKQGYEVFVSDMRKIKADYVQALASYQIPFEQGGHSENKVLNADLIIKSPGIPEKAMLIRAARQQEIPVIDELEWAFQFTDAQIIAITGSNGKTTTTRLIHHILQTAGLDVGLAGNVGFSLAKQVAENDRAIYVVEASSFQLDNIEDFRPNIAVLTTITADHLDRYEYKLENYIESKFRIVKNKQPDDIFIYNGDNENIQKGFEDFYPHSMDNTFAISVEGWTTENPELDVPHTNFKIAKADLTLMGRHNWFNTACAVLTAQKMGVDEEKIKQALTNFENEAHRLEYITSINGVDYVNDSKATNVDAVFYALEAMQKPVVWIVGGVDKGNDYAMLFELVKEKVRAIVCLGKDNSPILEAFKGIHEIIVETASVHEALKVSSLYAEQGDVVLLSPACASFDLFENYKARGNQFKNLVLQQKKILTEGVSVQMTLNIQMNPSEQKSDRGDLEA